MSQAASQVRPVVRGPSRFRVRVQLILTGLRPYGWEIYDEEDGETVRRSADAVPHLGRSLATPARRRWSSQTSRRQSAAHPGR